MKSRKLLFICLTIFLIPVITPAQYTPPAKWQQRINYIKSKYNELPVQKLDSITLYLDSTAIASHCYQFITNPGKTKFVALYLTDRNTNSFSLIKREYGGTYRWYTLGQEKKDSQIEAFAYTVSGMYYEGKWYYNVGEYVEFYAGSEVDAKNMFLIRVLNEGNFFVGNKESKKFWIKNDFERDAYPYKQEYPGKPKVVIVASNSEQVRRSHNKNRQVEQVSCDVSTGIWNDLHNLDPLKYHSRYKGSYMDNYCLALYNTDRNTVLLPIIYRDTAEKAYVIYYVLKILPTGNTLYRWKRFPEKEINRKTGDEGLEVVYDIRNYIKNWGWGTNNMISTSKFWEENFTDSDLEIAKYNNSSR